ncbi:MAG: hypothetical protein ACREPE_07030 [Lysobacter sp.]
MTATYPSAGLEQAIRVAHMAGTVVGTEWRIHHDSVVTGLGVLQEIAASRVESLGFEDLAQRVAHFNGVDGHVSRQRYRASLHSNAY